ncbi:probable phospholipid-transporting ATPase 4, partial [Tanacetum coccineum]
CGSCNQKFQKVAQEIVVILISSPQKNEPCVRVEESRLFLCQYLADLGARGKGIVSRIFSIPVTNCTSLSNPNPKPACGTGYRGWKRLCVGDVVKVQKNEYSPSDLLLLSSSYEDGICYVDTMNLESETNLKIKCCMGCMLCFDDAVKYDNFKATIRCEDPSPNIYSFVGNLEVGDEDEASTYPISP